jgi:hypothetical protein
MAEQNGNLFNFQWDNNLAKAFQQPSRFNNPALNNSLPTPVFPGWVAPAQFDPKMPN